MGTVLEILSSIKAVEMSPLLGRLYASPSGTELLDVLTKYVSLSSGIGGRVGEGRSANGAIIDIFTKEWPAITILLRALLPPESRLTLRVSRRLVEQGSTVLHQAGVMAVV